MYSLPRWLISITDMPLPCQSSISSAACRSTGSGSAAGPALKLKTRVILETPKGSSASKEAMLTAAVPFAGCAIASHGPPSFARRPRRIGGLFARTDAVPLKIPFTSLVVTGHRGSGLTGSQSIPWVQALSGQKKDAYAARARTAGHPELLPRPKPRNALPALSIKRMTDYTRFPDDKAVAKAAARTTLEPGTPPEVAAAVSNHLDRAFKAHAAPLILVGEQHSRRTSLMINLAAIASAKGRNAVVLFERGPDEIEKLVGHADMLDVELRVDFFSAIEARRKVMRDLSLDATRETTADILMAYVADKAGARIGAFDTPGARPPTRRSARRRWKRPFATPSRRTTVR